jgi:hypothetical protein
MTAFFANKDGKPERVARLCGPNGPEPVDAFVGESAEQFMTA